MDINCPECEATFPADNEEPKTCPACMFTFSITLADSLPQLMEVEVQGKGGEKLGVMDIYMIKELVYSGRLKGKESVRTIGGDWMPIADLLPVREIFNLVGIDLVKVKVSAQQVKGWKTKTVPQPKKRVHTKAATPTNTSREPTEVGRQKVKLVLLALAISAVATVAWLWSS